MVVRVANSVQPLALDAVLRVAAGYAVNMRGCELIEYVGAGCIVVGDGVCQEVRASLCAHLGPRIAIGNACVGHSWPVFVSKRPQPSAK
jgi:hypothetical protein